VTEEFSELTEMSINFKKRKKLLIVLLSVISVFAVIIAACAIYLGNYYHADSEAIDAFAPSAEVKEEIVEGNFVFSHKDALCGLIFYPGGKVEAEAYIPLMREISEHGFLCVLVEMPFNLAVFDINAANGIQESFPEIESWYIGGHSLGGSMAAAYLENNHESFDGLLLLGSYSTANLSKTNLRALSVYGSNDGVMNREKYNSSLANLPKDFKETVIDGGCHAYFGAYGEQKGDGKASITLEEQISICADTFNDWIKLTGLHK